MGSDNLSSTRSFASSRGDATDKDEWLEMTGRKRERRLPKRRQEKERGDYREGDKERHPGSKKKVGYPGFTILLP